MTTYAAGGAPAVIARPFDAPSRAERATPSAVRQPLVEEAMRQQAAALLQHLYRWLDAAAAAVPQVSAVVPMLVTAVQLYEAQQYPACRERVQSVMGVLRQARWAYPALPPL